MRRIGLSAFLSALILLCAYGLSLAPTPAGAQSAETLDAYKTQPHVGPPEEALVGLIVTNRVAEGTTQVRHGNGILLRCDGFVLAPEALFNVQNAPTDKVGKPNQSVTVVLYPGTDHEKRVAAQRPGYFGFLSVGDRWYRMTYAVLKIEDMHLPAPRALLPDALAPNDPVRLLWSAWSDSAARFLPPQTLAASIGARPTLAPNDPNAIGQSTPTERRPSPPNNRDAGQPPSPSGKAVPITPDAQNNAGTPKAGQESGGAQPGKPIALRPIPLFIRQMTYFAQPAPGVPAGAIVIGPENMVVGIVTDTAEAGSARFANFDSLDQVSNCIAAFPNTDAQYADFQKRLARGEDPTAAPPDKAAANPSAKSLLPPDPTATGAATPNTQHPIPNTKASPDGGEPGTANPLRAHSDMVTVPGGPVDLPSVLRAYQPDMDGRVTACLPPFQIDRFEVTNEQYLEFWKSLPAKQRREASVRASLYPYGWGDEAAPFPPDMATVPVLGVRLAGAKAYAKWVGKRLPTPYEWCQAAFGPTGGNKPPDWARKYIQARQDAWNQIVQEHLNYARAHPEILPGFFFNRDITGSAQIVPDWTGPVMEEFWQLPWFFLRPGFGAAAAWSKDCVKRFTDPLFKEWNDPLYVLPVGSRAYDVSPYGAADMVMNARELVLPGPQFPWSGYPNIHWPYKEIDRYMEVDWVTSNLLSHPSFVTGKGAYGLGLPVALDKAVPDANGFAFANIDALLQSAPFLNTNLLIGHSTGVVPQNAASVIVSPGTTFMHALLPLNSLVDPTPAENDSQLVGLYHAVPTYAFRMPSRRIRSAAQNANPGTDDFYPADLGDYVRAASAVQEYSEMLRPVDTLALNLVAGPTFDVPYWQSTGTWGIAGTFLQGVPTARSRNGRPAPTIAETGLQEWFADATLISLTGAYGAWAKGPDHFHAEMGRPMAIDASYPINTRNLKLIGGAAVYAPDTYLIPGGFRCAR